MQTTINVLFFKKSIIKNYAYQVHTPDQQPAVPHPQVYKIKGFTLNYKNSQGLNMSLLRDMVLSTNRESVVLTYDNIHLRRDP